MRNFYRMYTIYKCGHGPQVGTHALRCGTWFYTHTKNRQCTHDSLSLVRCYSSDLQVPVMGAPTSAQ